MITVIIVYCPILKTTQAGIFDDDREVTILAWPGQGHPVIIELAVISWLWDNMPTKRLKEGVRFEEVPHTAHDCDEEEEPKLVH